MALALETAMAYFEWADDLVIDHGPIDDDHRHLVELVNQLHTATSEGKGIEVVDGILKNLIEYTKGHLRREEALMTALRFPQLAQHKVYHDRFTEHIDALKQKYDAGSITVAAQLSTVLRDWLSIHIRRSDKEIRYFMDAQAKQGQRPSRS